MRGTRRHVARIYNAHKCARIGVSERARGTDEGKCGGKSARTRCVTLAPRTRDRYQNLANPGRDGHAAHTYARTHVRRWLRGRRVSR